MLPAALLLLVLCLVASAPAKTLREKLDATQGKLSHVRESQSALAATIAEQNQAIDSMLGEVSQLRQEQEALESELEDKQDELDRATAELEAEKRRLERIRERLQRALDVLRDRLVAIYEAGSPDVLSVVLESETWSQASVRAEYLSRVQDYDDAVAGRVKGLRDEAKARSSGWRRSACSSRKRAMRSPPRSAKPPMPVPRQPLASASSRPPRRSGRNNSTSCSRANRR